MASLAREDEWREKRVEKIWGGELESQSMNRLLKRQIARFGETVSRQFHAVLNSVLRLHDIMFRNPEPIPDNSTDDRWKWFKGCLGALDDTFIKVNVETVDRPRYRTRKGEIATNVLGVCTPDMHFIYVLPGWEGSAADGRVLRDAISRKNGLMVPQEIEVPQMELDNDYEEELITHCETSSAWTEWRDKLAYEMFTNWQSLHH
ncbi:uncharacterized protein LOC116013132 [Ipomoea triloba]|uniref:uncharacterized protein LOC116013132 n=1 Tax=Ipomoea triloba TaxID=35885 RepID=UPI00125DD40E|nr:uncharacterized protein LOC116013132 [Ipomoea triloba]